jgi:integrase
MQLPNNCRCSNITVSPKNWNQKGASTDVPWRIYYRFYDPAFEKPKEVIIKSGLNKIKDLQERRTVVKELIKHELYRLKVLGDNPIRKIKFAPVDVEYEIAPETPFIYALNLAKEKLTVGHRTRVGIKSVITGVEKAARQYRIDQVPISKVTRRHLKIILEQCGKNSERWSNVRYNSYRGYLLMLFKELVELEAVNGNPVRDISKKPVTKKIKAVLSDEQRKKVNEHLLNVFPKFYSFVHLFFHSGGRKTELLKLKPPMVDLVNQKYRCVIKKRKTHVEVERTIKDVALPFWMEFLKDCPDDHYIFGTLFMPGLKPMGMDSPSRYWERHVKKELGIDVDFYALKHLHTTELVTALTEEEAAAHNAHTSTGMVVSIYDVKQKDRQHQRIKKVNNPF